MTREGAWRYQPESVVSRRQVLAAGGAVAAVGIAGCSGDSLTDSSGDGTPIGSGTTTATATETATATGTETATATATETPTPQPVISYEPITGTWTTKTYRLRHKLAELEIVEARAAVGTEIGTFRLLTEVEDGYTLCSWTLSAAISNPPTYTVALDSQGGFPCSDHGLHRYRHEEDDTLRWYTYYPDKNQWEGLFVLEREGG